MHPTSPTASSTSSTAALVDALGGPAAATVPIAPAGARLERDDLLLFDVVHQAMRLQLRALVLALEEIRPDQRRDVDEVRRWFGSVVDVLHHHHAMEDEVVFPLAGAEDPDVDRLRAAMAADHEQLDHALEAMAWSLEALDRAEHVVGATPAQTLAEAVATARELLAVVEAHLDHEEAAALPVLLARVGRRAYLAATEAASGDHDVKLFAFVAPWLLPSCTPDQADRFYAEMPRMIRHVNRFVWIPRYERSFPRMTAAAARVRAEQAATIDLRDPASRPAEAVAA